MDKKIISLIVIVLAAAAFLGYFIWQGTSKSIPKISNQSLIVEKITASDGREIKLEDGAVLPYKFSIRGKVKNWMYEGEFPVFLTDSAGQVYQFTSAKAQGEWMTTDYVQFTAEMDLTGVPIMSNELELVFRKSNPSGDPKLDEQVSFAVTVE